MSRRHACLLLVSMTTLSCVRTASVDGGAARPAGTLDSCAVQRGLDTHAQCDCLGGFVLTSDAEGDHGCASDRYGIGLSEGSLCCLPESSDPLAVGTRVPPLRHKAHNGEEVDLGQVDRATVVYFYPKDDTPGCTAEACAFRDAWDRYEAGNIAIVGVSSDSDESHREFSNKHGFVFPLIADEDHTWAKAFGVPTRLGMTMRVSFLIGPDGKIAKVYPTVDPGLHSEEILRDVANL